MSCLLPCVLVLVRSVKVRWVLLAAALRARDRELLAAGRRGIGTMASGPGYRVGEPGGASRLARPVR
jgi:hypothetical protein